MDLNSIKESIVEHVYHISKGKKVPLHKHDRLDEIFYCMKGSGFGVSEEGEVELSVGDTFVAAAGTMHSLRSDEDLYVCAILVPVVDSRSQ